MVYQINKCGSEWKLARMEDEKRVQNYSWNHLQCLRMQFQEIRCEGELDSTDSQYGTS